MANVSKQNPKAALARMAVGEAMRERLQAERISGRGKKKRVERGPGEKRY